MFGGFAVVALALAAIGIYGVISFSVASRRREMGIRLALGGGRSRIRHMIQAQSMKTVVTGTILGALLTPVIGRVLGSALFRVRGLGSDVPPTRRGDVGCHRMVGGSHSRGPLDPRRSAGLDSG